MLGDSAEAVREIVPCVGGCVTILIIHNYKKIKILARNNTHRNLYIVQEEYLWEK